MSDKYIAGFIDADGCFDIKVNKVKDRYYISPRIRISQKFKTTLLYIQKHFGWGIVRTTKEGYYEWAVDGRKAKTISARLYKHLVLKQEQAKFIKDFEFSGSWSKEDVKKVKKLLKDKRFKAGKPRNFPTRKWLAGYVDGDGCVTATLKKGRNKPSVAFMITADRRDKRALELINKNFGGYIQNKTSRTCRLDIWLNKTNSEKLITYFNKHLKLKKNQFNLVLDWFRNKHKYSSRETTKDFIKKLRDFKAAGND